MAAPLVLQRPRCVLHVHAATHTCGADALHAVLQGGPQAFTAYLKRYGNTICGRHPISVFLNVRMHPWHALQHSRGSGRPRFSAPFYRRNQLLPLHNMAGQHLMHAASWPAHRHSPVQDAC